MNDASPVPWRAPFRDRRHAGRVLAEHLRHHGGKPGTVVLGLPRGGVPVAYEVARALGAPLDVFLVRKLGVPGHEELAMGAIASGGTRVLNQDVIERLGVSGEDVEAVTANEAAVLAAREQAYRGDRPPVVVEGATVVVVDDGLATGASMRAALVALRRQRPAALVVAVPIASAESCQEMRAEAEEVVCACTPAMFFAVGRGYEDFSPTGDEEVQELLAGSSNRLPGSGSFTRPG